MTTDYPIQPDGGIDIFRYAEPIAPLPTTQSKIKPPASGSAKSGSAMRPIMPKLGERAKLPSPIPPDTKQLLPSPHPEVPAKPVVPPALRAGNPETLQQRIPRPKKPRYQLQVPMKEAYDRAHDEILGEMNKVTHPEDKERYREEIEDLEKVFVSGSERLMTRFLEDHVGWKTFRNLVQSLKDEEPVMTSRPGIYGRANEDIFRYADPGPLKPIPTSKPTAPMPPHVQNAHSVITGLVNEWGDKPEDINSGNCETFACEIAKRLPKSKPMTDDNEGHHFVEFMGRYYDAEHPEGVDNYNHLKQVIRDRRTKERTKQFERDDADIFRYEEDPEARIKTVKGLEGKPPNPLNPSAWEVKPPVPSADKLTAKATPPKPPLRKMGVHPLPEKTADPWWHDTPHTNWLRHADEISRTPLQSSGGTRNVWKINLGGEAPGHDYGAIWKARDDDNTAIARPWTIPEGNPHGHEAAAWEMAHILGLGGMVPPTVSRANRNQVGSAQHFVPDQDKAIRSPFPFGKPGNAQLPLAAAFDALTMNTDRHMGNWLVDPTSGQLTLIDHGLLFPHTHKKPLVGNGEILGHAMNSGVPIPAETVEWVKEWPHLERSMKRNGLTDDQIALTQSRLFSLADAAAKGDSWRQWLKKSGIGSNYLLK